MSVCGQDQCTKVQQYLFALRMKTVTVNGEEIAYQDINPHEKRVVVLIHGNMSSHKWWQVTVDDIKQGLRVLAVDMRGFGDSSYKSPITLLDHLAGDVVQLCYVLGIQQATFVGWSLGGLVVMKIAELRPELAEKIVLTCSVGHLGLKFIDVIEGATIPLQEIKKLQRLQVMDTAIKERNSEVVKVLFKMLLLTFIKQKFRPFAEQLSSVVFQQRNYFDSMFVIANPGIDISKIKAKWLILAGEKDAVIPMDNIQPTIEEVKKRKYPHRVKIFQDGGHMLPLEHPEEYAKLLREFVFE